MSPIHSLHSQPRYPLTSTQREIWFDQTLHPRLPLYNVAGYTEIPDVVDPALFQQAVNLLIQRHDALRLQLLPEGDEDGVPLQTIVDTLSVTVPLYDLSSEPDPRQAAMDWMGQHFVETFPLIQTPLFRYVLIGLGEGSYLWHSCYHHLITDGWGAALFNRSLGEIYSALLAGQPPPPTAPSYTAFIDADRAYIDSASVETQRRYWREHYRVIPEPLLTPRYHQARQHHGLAPSEVTSLFMPRGFYDRLEQLAQGHRVSRFHVLLAALYVYFTRAMGREELIIGLPVLNRANARFRHTAGLFVGTSPVCFDLGTDLALGALLQGIARTLKASYRHQRLPMSEIHRAIGLDGERRRLFDVSLSYESHDYSADFGEIPSQSTLLLHPWEQTPLMVYVRDFHAQAPVKFDFVYNTAYFAAWEVEALQQRLMALLEAMLSTESQSIRHLPLMTPAERAQLRAWNQTRVDVPTNQTVVDLFEQQAQRRPDHRAVIFEGEQLSYAELNARANQLAHDLIARSIGPGTLVGICLPRSPMMFVALLGVLKAGAAYLPLDPEYPTQRLHFMVEDSQAVLLLAQTTLGEQLAGIDTEILWLDAAELFCTCPDENPPNRAQTSDLAYVMYTSGSTGKPKGVMVEIAGLTRHCQDIACHFQIRESDRVLQFASFAFDASVEQIFSTWLQGATLVVPADNRLDPERLADLIAEMGISLAEFPPAYWQQFCEVNDGTRRLSSLRQITLTGDVFPLELARRTRERFPALSCLNTYGPTETTITATSFTLPKGELPASYTSLPIGRPFPGTTVHLLNPQRQPVPMGVPGELYIGGFRVTRGYLNRPELTAERFVTVEIFGQRERLYRSGDLARWLPNGNLEFLGRVDHQIKLRGFRIEPGEIEAVLAEHEAVREAVVVLREAATGPALAAYVTLGELALDVAKLRDWLKARLPEYMVPATFTMLDTLPLTPNGKLDRRALPEPEVTPSGTGRALHTETEHLLASLWQAVLGVDITHPEAHFFELGGHSLLATRLASRARETFGIEIPLAMVFDSPVLADLADWLDHQRRGLTLPPITPQAPDAPRVLSHAQQRLWFLARLEGPSATYNMPAALRLRGVLDQQALRETFRELVIRHQSLRLCFPEVNGAPTVVELPAYDPLLIQDLCDLDADQQEIEVQRLASEHGLAPFDLACGPLLRVQVLLLGDTEQVLLINLHHSIADGVSISVLVREWRALYQAACQGISAELLALPISYTDYAAWQRQWLQGKILQAQLDYWSSALDGAPQLLELPTDHPRPPVASYRGAQLHSHLDVELTQALVSLAREREVTLFMTLLAAFSVLLQRHTGQGDLLIGSPIANRTQHHTEGLIGFFVNTLVLRTRPGEVNTFGELLDQVRDTALGAYAHQDLPFETLVEHLNPSRSLSHSPLFQVMLVLQNNDSTELALPGLDIKPLDQQTPIAKFDLSLDAVQDDQGLALTWEFATDLFDAHRIQRMGEHFEILLRGIVDAPEEALHRLPLLTPAEIDQLQAWNQTKVDVLTDQSVVDLFEQQVQRRPDHIAVIFEGESLSYADLNSRANHLAHDLIARGIGSGTLVGICLPRSPMMFVALLGVLKTGAAYLPLDPAYPTQRLRLMVEDSQAVLLLAQTTLGEQLAGIDTEILWLDAAELFCTCPDENPPNRAQTSDLAYVMYTSGSTGKPKGVMVEVGGLTRHCLDIARHFQIRDTERVLQFASFAFDASVEQIFSTWLQGATLVVPADNRLDPERLADQIAELGVSVAEFPPAYWQQLCEVDDGARRLSSLRQITLTGDVFPLDLARRTRERFAALSCLNTYGPTETTITATSFALPAVDMLADYTSLPIGRPLPGTRVYLLDQQQQPVPIGVPGELYIGGFRVARGYLNRPKLTAERFVTVEIFGQRERLYRSGDLARWLPDGNLEFLGRFDNQVKLRGLRIELGEIEALLVEHEAVREAAVVLQHQSNPALVAYIIPGDDSVEIPALRGWLKSRLPEYMVPARFVALNALPLTPNGKLDRKALSTLEIPEDEFQAPRNAVEQKLAHCWARVLKRADIGIHDNFFALGGDSILSIQIIARAREAGLGLRPRDLFEHQTIAELAQVVGPLHSIEAEQGQVQGAVPLTPIQALFFAQDHPTPQHYNQAVLLETPVDLDEAALAAAFLAVIEHHDALRLRYCCEGGIWRQDTAKTPSPTLPLIRGGGSSNFHVETLTGPDLATALAPRADHWHASLNLQQGPLTRLVLFRHPQGTRLLWIIHHLVVDGVSWRILLEDLFSAYHQARSASSIALPAKTSSFKAWSEHLARWRDGPELDAEAAFWRTLPAAAPLPVDYPDTPGHLTELRHHTLVLDADTTRTLETAPRAYHAGVEELLLCALVLTLREWSGAREHLIDLESHGRAELFEALDLNRTVGWFTAVYGVALRVADDQDLDRLIKTVKEQRRRVPHLGIGHGLLTQRGEILPRAQVLFNYLGRFEQPAEQQGFRLARESTGQAQAPETKADYPLEINGLITHGSLQLEISYCPAQYRPATIEELAQRLGHHLNKLLTHCRHHHGYTPSDFPLVALEQPQLDALQADYGDTISGIYPLTPTQQGLLFHSLHAPHSGLYIDQLHWRLRGTVHPAGLRAAWQALMERHGVLRASFRQDHGRPLQIICRGVRLPWAEHDWRAHDSDSRAQKLSELLDQRRREGFPLGQAPLMLVELIRESDEHWRLVWHSHHLLFDGWSLATLVEDFLAIYTAGLRGETAALAPVADYRQYLAWLGRQDLDAAHGYWRQYLSGFTDPTPIPIAQQTRESPQRGECERLLDVDSTARLAEFARGERITLSTLIQAAWALLLGRYADTDQVVFGVTVSGRSAPLPDIEGMVGLLINTLPRRVHLNDELRKILRTLQADQQAADQHHYASLAEIQRLSAVPAGTNLFDTILSFENYPLDEALRESVHSDDFHVLDQTHYLLTLAVVPGESLAFKLGFDRARIDPVAAARVLAHLEVLLMGMVADPTADLRHLPLLSDQEIRQLRAWNQTEAEFPTGQSIADLFEVQVRATPEATAVLCEDQALSFAELDDRATRLALHLRRDHSVVAGARVGVCLGRSPALVVALLAIFKAEGVYVPLDPDYPAERLQFMVEDSQAAVILSQRTLVQWLPTHTKLVDLEVLSLTSDAAPLPRHGDGNQPAYVIYTSGSTGQPKGVVGHHTGLLNRFAWMWREIPFDSDERLVAKTALGFLDSLWELLGGLLRGVPTVMLAQQSRDVEALVESLARHQVTRLVLVPSLLEALLAMPEVGTKLRRIRHWTSSGEALSPRLARAFYRVFPQARLLNLYGSSEVAADVLCWPVPATTELTAVWLGKPLANTRAYVLDRQFQPMPVGVAGELCIGGVQLALGYLDRPELSAERFVEVEVLGRRERLFRSGDRVRRLSDGNLEYLGRLDQQIKLRGFRIEPGEIQAALMEHPGVGQALVVLRETDIGAALVGYVIANVRNPPQPPFKKGGGEEGGMAELRAWLKNRLPDYMVPAHLITLDAFPLNPNGKLDRDALPAPEIQASASTRPLATETERLLATLWAEVLNVEIQDAGVEFFALGGHSLLATRLVTRIRDAFAVEMPLAVLFEHPQLAELADWLDRQQRGAPLAPITPQPTDTPLVLSHAQQRLWFLAQLEGASASYHIPAALRLSGRLDGQALRRSFAALTERQQSLRLVFPVIDGVPTLDQLDPYDPLVINDLRELPESAQTTELARLTEAHATEPFDLASGPLLRVSLVQLSDTEQLLLVNIHHLIADGWSMGVLLREWLALYQAFSDNRTPTLAALPIHYSDYAAWQRQWLQGEVLQSQLNYWITQLADAPQLLELPTDHPRPAVQSFRGAELSTRLDADLSEQLQALARRQGTTLFMTLLAAFNVLLYRYTGQSDLLIGSPIANRTQQSLENLIGLFVNTLVLRARLDQTQIFSELLAQVRHTTLGAYAHQDLPFEYLVEQLNPQRRLSHSPLFQVMFALQNTEGVEPSLPGLTIGELETHLQVARFDLTLVVEQRDGLILSWEYASELFEAERIQRMAGHFETLLRGIVQQPDGDFRTLTMLTPGEIAQLRRWNHTSVARPTGQTVVDLFEAQVAAKPQATAVVFADQSLSYAELNARANRLAHGLIRLGVEAEHLVGLCVERSLEMIIGLLAVLKAGGAYLPLDPDYPTERLRFMLADSMPTVLITQSSLRHRLPESPATQLLVDATETIDDQLGQNPQRRSGPEQLAYVIYTSGSTGQPKGVMIEHHSWLNLILVQQERLHLGPGSRCLQFASLNFDASVFEIGATLSSGATLQLMDKHQALDATRFAHWLDQQGITHALLPPSLLAVLPPVRGLGHLVVGGEASSQALARRWASGRCLINAYGPTEITVCATFSDPLDGTMTPPIGRPIANTRLYVLDAHRQPLPVGVPGELAIAGDGLARGYLNRPELTAERFLTLKLFGKSERVYLSGDRVRWRADGNLEYLGRLDQQLKLRGFRIEPGEIEAVLGEHPTVREAVVVLHEEADTPMLVAYLIPADQDHIDSPTLRDWLQSRLPEQMIPTHFVAVDAFPLTPNGKLDRQALPAPGKLAPESEFQAPRNAIEQQLAHCWAAVLRRGDIGIHDNFFALGGDSILSIQIIARARQAGLGLTPRDLFEQQTITQLAQVVRPLQTLEAEQGLVRGVAPLTPIQHWFLHGERPAPHHFNQAVLLEAPEQVNASALTAALSAVIHHHDALRLRFRREVGVWEQYHDEHEDTETPFHVEILDNADLAEALMPRADHWQASLDLNQGPLTRLVLFRHSQGTRLLWIIHHLLVDGVSWRILLEDLLSAYQQACAGSAIALPPKTSSFKAWAEHLAHWASDSGLETEAEVWRGLPMPTPLPVDYSEAHNHHRDIRHHTLVLDADSTRKLLHAPSAYRAGVEELLLCALVLALHEWSGEAEQLVELESHGRAEDFEALDLSRTVGWFTAVYSVAFAVADPDDLDGLIKSLKERRRRVPHRGIGYGLLVQRGDTLPRGRVLFNYLGQFDGLIQQEGFGLAREDVGQTIAPGGERYHEIEINGLIAHDTLQLDISYSGARHRPTTIEALGERLRHHLSRLIAHCQHHHGYTPGDFPLVALTQTRLDELAGEYGNTIVGIYPLTPLQQGLLFHSLHEPHRGLYVEQWHWRLRGTLQPEVLRGVWQRLLERHAILRAAFHHQHGEPVQTIHDQVKLPWVEHHWQDLDEEAREARLQRLLQGRRHQGFTLNQAPLMGFDLIRETGQSWRLVWHHHHLLLDGWSLPILVEEMSALYAARLRGDSARLPPVADFRHYLGWLGGQNQAAAHGYWQGYLAGFTEPTPIPIAQRGDDSQTQRGEIELSLDTAATTRLTAFARSQRVTLNTLVQAAWALLLGRYSDTIDVVFGVTVSGRTAPIAGIEGMVGLFINTLPMRVRLDGNLPEMLRALQTDQQQANQHAHASLAEIQRLSQVATGTGLFDSILVFENYPLGEAIGGDDTLCGDDLQGLEQTHYLLTLAVNPEETLSLALGFDAWRIDPADARRMLAHLERLLSGMVENPQLDPRRLPLLTAEEIAQLRAWNQTDQDISSHQTVVALFEAQVAATPTATALIVQENSLSYAELNTRANRLAHALIQRGIGAEDLVGLCVQRSPAMVVGLLGLLKAGAVHLPLDPEYPTQRLRLMLEDSHAAVLLTQASLRDRLPGSQLPKLWLDEAEPFAEQPAHNPTRRINPTDLAYVIYTSGSSGAPKGVMVEHASLALHCQDMCQRFALSAGDRVLQFASFSFDVSLEQILCPLLVGATLVVSTDTRPDPDRLMDYLSEQRVSVADLSPGYWQQLCQSPRAAARLASLRLLIVGGEVLPAELARQTRQRFPALGCLNDYGPTEATITVTSYPLPSTEVLETLTTMPIGRPLANTRIHLLDRHGQPVPVGIPGELCIAGERLARGYLNRPELTAERFVEIEIFGQRERVYRTGDLAHWLADGNLAFLGRRDSQVKLRGFRIELGEIEALLSRHPAVSEAAVVLREDRGNPALAAYLVPASGHTLDQGGLRQWLGDRLPAHMIPASFTLLDALPLSPNAKLDRKALPAPEAAAQHSSPPRDTVELRLLNLWQQVLGVDNPGLQQNFFEAGGHSLLAMRLMGEIRQQFGVSLPISLLFQCPTVASLASHLRSENPPTAISHCVPMQATGEGLPLFLLPGAVGSVLYLQPLAAALGTERPIYALQTPGLHGEPTPQSVEALAAHHLGLIREQQPRGPYHLAGHSSGGPVAFEMAHQLEQAGETVAWLGILDSRAPDPDPEMDDRPVQWLWALVENIQDLTAVDLGLTLSELDALDHTSAAASVLGACQSREVIFAPGTTLEEFGHWLRVYRATALAHGHYQSHARLDCPIHLFRAQESLASVDDSRPVWGWCEHTHAGVQEIVVPGGHISMMSRPQALAMAMRHRLLSQEALTG